MDEKRKMLRHYLAALAYRTQKALRDAPDSFAGFRIMPGIRTPHELLFHMTNVLGCARTFFTGGKYRLELMAGPGGDTCECDTSVTTYYIYSYDGRLLREYTGSTLIREFIYAGGQRIAQVNQPSGDIFYFYTDHLGSTRLLIDGADGSSSSHFAYYPYGLHRRSVVSDCTARRFTGQEFDDEGNIDQHYFGARYLHSAQLRFTTIDPLADMYPGWSPYVYALANPLRYIDPLGLTPGGGDGDGQPVKILEPSYQEEGFIDFIYQEAWDVVVGVRNWLWTVWNYGRDMDQKYDEFIQSGAGEDVGDIIAFTAYGSALVLGYTNPVSGVVVTLLVIVL